MAITHRRLNRATLARQLLLERGRLPVVEGMRRIVAIQAQEPPSPAIALWNRLADFDPADLAAAFADQRIVKGTLMRVTLHAVHAADYPTFLDAMQPTLRAARLNDARFRRTGIAKEELDALVPAVLEYASVPRSNAEAEAWLDERLGVLPKPGVWWALRQTVPLVHAPTGGPWSFGPRPSYVAAPDTRRLDRSAESLQVLIRRYLEGFGPASVQDIGQFGLINRPRIRAAIEALGDALVRLPGPGRAELYDVPGAPLPDDDTPAPPRLLPMWDSTLLAYADRERIIPEAYRKLVIRSNGDVLPTMLVDGYVAGVWRPAAHGGIEASAFHPLPDETWAGLDAEAGALVAFLAPREPVVYRRYGRWWAGLPADEVRVIGI